MTSSVRNFSSEGWSKSVNIGKCTGKVFNRELSRNSEESWFLEKVFSVIDSALLVSRDVLNFNGFRRFRKDSGNLEHFTFKKIRNSLENNFKRRNKQIAMKMKTTCSFAI